MFGKMSVWLDTLWFYLSEALKLTTLLCLFSALLWLAPALDAAVISFR